MITKFIVNFLLFDTNIYSECLSIHLPIRLNPRKGHRRVPGNQVLGLSVFFVSFLCNVSNLLVVSERRASACLIMLSAK